MLSNVTSPLRFRPWFPWRSLPARKPFASFAVRDDAEKVVLDIPASTGSLYVSYRKADGSQVGKTVAVSNGKISFAVGADAAPADMTRGGGNDYDNGDLCAGRPGRLGKR